MNSSAVGAWVLVLASAAWSMFATTSAWQAHRDSQRAHARLAAVGRDAQELVQLRAGLTAAVHEKQPETVLVSAVSTTLVAAGMPSSTLTSLTPDSATAAEGSAFSLGGSPFRRQGARLTLEPLNLSQLGRFLSRWRDAQPRWIVRTIELSPRPPSKRGDATDELSAQLVLETAFLDRRTP